ncbi:hypothetical protein ACTWJ8_40710 (plasmid) [Streptomyces sp. SDT5-1]|uniref:hypothetical protein n=1 Tax=Streptomyces sp. SDT5-1 TaxID=3406418 RepID=UPI003FD01493
MALLTAEALYRILTRAPRRRDLIQDGIRLVYDGNTMDLSSADLPDTVLASVTTRQPVLGAWEVTAYCATLDTIRSWLRSLDDREVLVDVCPFWGGPTTQIVFAIQGFDPAAFPVIDCPTAPTR